MTKAASHKGTYAAHELRSFVFNPSFARCSVHRRRLVETEYGRGWNARHARGSYAIIRKAVVLWVLATNVTFGSAALSQWPLAPVRMVVPFAAGGINDLLARGFGEAIAQSLGHQFVIENRAGGAGAIGTQAVARAVPDGQLLLVSGMGVLAVSPAVNSSLGYDPLSDFTHIGFLGGTPHVLVVHPRLSVKSFSDSLQRQERRPRV
jgi:tripartite-type tricarboxylate transporter receptor subunit TctC